jgi:DNA-binding transcriptional LysR family regulator
MRAFEVFVAVAERGSITAAAATMRITQSAISQQIKMLEKEMGGKLVDRNKRPLRLTPAGIILRTHASLILLQAEQARAEVRQVESSPLPHLRIAMFDTLAKTLAPAIVDAVVNEKLPIKTVSVFRGMSAHHAREVSMREVDVVITSNALYEAEGIERHELINERFVLIVPNGALPSQSSLRDISSRLPLIRYSNRTEVGRLIEQHLRRQRLEIPQTFSFDAAEDVFSMIDMGHGWAVTAPTHVVHAVRQGMSIEIRQLPKPALSRSIMLVARVGELGNLPREIANFCRRVLRRDYLPQLAELMPDLANNFVVVDDSEQAYSPQAK